MGVVPYYGAHTSSNLAAALSDLFKKTLAVDVWSMSWKAPCTTDCGANIAKAVDTSELFFWLKCVLHILHNSVKAGLEGIGAFDGGSLSKCKAFVQHLSTHVRAAEKFREIQ